MDHADRAQRDDDPDSGEDSQVFFVDGTPSKTFEASGAGVQEALYVGTLTTDDNSDGPNGEGVLGSVPITAHVTQSGTLIAVRFMQNGVVPSGAFVFELAADGTLTHLGYSQAGFEVVHPFRPDPTTSTAQAWSARACASATSATPATRRATWSTRIDTYTT